MKFSKSTFGEITVTPNDGTGKRHLIGLSFTEVNEKSRFELDFIVENVVSNINSLATEISEFSKARYGDDYRGDPIGITGEIEVVIVFSSGKRVTHIHEISHIVGGRFYHRTECNENPILGMPSVPSYRDLEDLIDDMRYIKDPLIRLYCNHIENNCDASGPDPRMVLFEDEEGDYDGFYEY